MNSSAILCYQTKSKHLLNKTGFLLHIFMEFDVKSFVYWQLYKAALGNCFEQEEWGPIEFFIMAKHFERQGKSPYAYHAVS